MTIIIRIIIAIVVAMIAAEMIGYVLNPSAGYDNVVLTLLMNLMIALPCWLLQIAVNIILGIVMVVLQLLISVLSLGTIDDLDLSALQINLNCPAF